MLIQYINVDSMALFTFSPAIAKVQANYRSSFTTSSVHSFLWLKLHRRTRAQWEKAQTEEDDVQASLDLEFLNLSSADDQNKMIFIVSTPCKLKINISLPVINCTILKCLQIALLRTRFTGKVFNVCEDSKLATSNTSKVIGEQNRGSTTVQKGLFF